MLLTLKNTQITLRVETLGAQMMSIRDDDGLEYLWQGDANYWEDRAPTLFPIIGRLWQGTHQADGKKYPLGIHGFAAGSEFETTKQGEDFVTLRLMSNAGTLKAYPYDFSFEITYRLEGKILSVSYRVENRADAALPFAIGGHPGFRVPLEEGKAFDDYVLEFSQPCTPDRIGFTDTDVLLSGENKVFPLADGCRIPLRHDLFDNDAIILQNMAREVTLRPVNGGKSVTVKCPDMPYLGFWHWPKRDAPYVCIEPWSSLPGRQDVVEDLNTRSDFIHLPAGQVWQSAWQITIA